MIDWRKLFGGAGGGRDDVYASGAFFLTADVGVSEADVADARTAPGEIGRPLRLDDRAVAIPTRLGPPIAERLATMREAAARVDVNFVPAAVTKREKRLLIADMDSTIIGCECIDEIADFAGVKPEVSAITERAMQGALDFEGALRERVGLLAGLDVATLAEVYEERVRLNPGARVLVRTMAARGAETALVSGGFTFFAERVAEAAGFSRAQANVLIDRDGRLTGEVAEPILGRDAKRSALEAVAAEIGATPADAVAVGDGANDLEMMRVAGLGVAYRAKPIVAAEADAAIERSDLTALLSLQGVGAAEFVS